MTVSVGATPTEVNLNATTPAAPANSVNVAWQAGAQYDDPNFPGYTVRDTSASVAAATTSVLGVVKPDGTTITILADGTISSSGGGGGTFVDGITPTGATGTAFVLPSSPSPALSLMLVQQIAGFGGIVLIAGTDYTLAGANITTINTITTGTLRAWYRL